MRWIIDKKISITFFLSLFATIIMWGYNITANVSKHNVQIQNIEQRIEENKKDQIDRLEKVESKIDRIINILLDKK